MKRIIKCAFIFLILAIFAGCSVRSGQFKPTKDEETRVAVTVIDVNF